MSEAEPAHKRKRLPRVIVSVIGCVAVLGAAGAASYAIFTTEPVAQREGATRTSAALVEVQTVGRGEHRPVIDVLGEVRPAREVELSAEVGGRIVGVDDAFEPGSRVPAGTELIRIDPTDFEQTLVVRRSERRQVEAELDIERGRQDLAREEYELLGDVVDEQNRSLVLREPQIAALEARLEAAVAAEVRAQADLRRTRISAPFDVMVMSRDVDIGSTLAPGESVGRLVGTDRYWVFARVPMRAVRQLELDSPAERAGNVIARHSAWGPSETRRGRVARLVGGVDERSRLARVLVTLDDPLGLEEDGPPVLLGTVLRLSIEGRPIEDTVRIEREHVRRDNTAWVMVDGKLDIRSLDIAFEDAAYAYVRGGLDDGDRVVTTTLATVTQGLPLRTADTTGEGDTGDSDVGADRP